MHDQEFCALVKDFYRHNRRNFPWRDNPEPYGVFVSELMLQQTQTTRVVDYYSRFLSRFPDFGSLAAASLTEVLELWQGLGYNRRARFMKMAAEQITTVWGGNLPADESSLRALPGIGPNTAASILAFAFNLPTVFIETNIRTVYLHHFFPESAASDEELLPLVARTLDLHQARDWYYALMDYGVHLKRTIGNANRRSPAYVRQSRFEGSVRQVRGAILKALLSHDIGIGRPDRAELLAQTAKIMGLCEPNSQETLGDRYAQALQGLLTDGLVAENTGRYRLPG